jgi:hypothetical protein
LDIHGHSETFYQFFLNEVMGWNLINENEHKPNVEAIDLIDQKNKLVIQVSATATKQKIESSLSKESVKGYIGYRFKFVAIAGEANELRKSKYKNPHAILFDPTTDIIDNQSILSSIKSLDISHLKRIYEFVKKELATEIDSIKLESNLATVINILSKEDLGKMEKGDDVIGFEIDRKISHNNLNSAKEIIADYVKYYGRVDKIYSEFDAQGSNKSISVLSAIKREYAKAKNISGDDNLFFEVVDKVIERVRNSSNFSAIPFDELELCVNILVVDAFVRCKIFENPENYNYAAT